MRNIQKKAEPNSLKQHRCSANADYDNFGTKDDLRQSLVSEQRGICCYCMQRIRPSDQKMKIEHWKCQSNYSNQQLNYSNLLAACKGGEGRRSKDQHCDTKKQNFDLTYCPSKTTHNVELHLKYLGDGTIVSGDSAMSDDINRVLNLNEARLVKNRKKVLEAFQERLGKKRVTTAALQRELAKWNGDSGGDLDPFCQVIVYYLRKKLKIT